MNNYIIEQMNEDQTSQRFLNKTQQFYHLPSLSLFLSSYRLAELILPQTPFSMHQPVGQELPTLSN